ncbi:MAG: hypothetical protein AAGM67_20935, partial [Bacteroidota bacterium]
TSTATGIQSILSDEVQRIPSKRTIQRMKKRLGFRWVPVQKKPMLSLRLMRERLEFCEHFRNHNFSRTIVLDEKWFSESTFRHAGFERTKDTPVNSLPTDITFRAANHETKTQQIKLMFLCAVSNEKKIGMYELDFQTWNRKNMNYRTGNW